MIKQMKPLVLFPGCVPLHREVLVCSVTNGPSSEKDCNVHCRNSSQVSRLLRLKAVVKGGTQEC